MTKVGVNDRQKAQTSGTAQARMAIPLPRENKVVAMEHDSC